MLISFFKFYRRSFTTVVISATALIIFVAWIYYFIIPVEEIHRLKNENVKISFVRGEIQQIFTKHRPIKWAYLREINFNAYHAILVSEDWDFYNHNGLDANQIKEAVGDILTGRRYRGASTITQQLTKNLFLGGDYLLWRKFQEFFIALYMEKVLSKKRILEIYLNIIQYGPRIYGIKSAAKHYFNKRPSQLTPREGAFLAMLLPSPNRYAYSFKIKKLTNFAKTTIESILLKMVVGKYISQTQAFQEINTPFEWEDQQEAQIYQ